MTRCKGRIEFVTLVLFVLTAAILAVPAHAASELPKVGRSGPSVKPLDLSRPPTIEELMAAGQLGGPLYPTHEIRSKQKEQRTNLSFGEAIQEWNKHEYKKAIKLFKKHIEEFPDSPWVSEAVLHMGCDAQYNGRYSEAEESFDWILDQNKSKEYEGAKILRNKATLRLAVLKVYQNKFARALELFRDLKMQSSNWRDRTYASHWLQRLSRYTANERAMLTCGTQALAYVLRKEGKETEAREVLELQPETIQGQNIRTLSDIASRYGQEFAALRVPPSDSTADHSTPWYKSLPLPAIVHISGRNEGDSGHYWILDKVDGKTLELFDPQSGRRFSQSPEEFSKEWSGIALVFSSKGNLPGTRLDETEMEQIYGGCCGIPRAESNLGSPGRCGGPNGGTGCLDSTGAPAWSVNVVNMNLFMTDTPLWYSSPIGPPVHITLSYNSESAIAQSEPFGNKWQLNYGSYLVVDTAGQVTVFMPDGRRDVYSPDGAGGYTRPYQVFSTLTKIEEPPFTSRYELSFSDGTVYVYDIPTGTSSLQPFLIEIHDAHGQSLTIGYDANVHLTTITDAMNRQITLTYNAASLVTQATLEDDPLGRSASFEYDANRNLTKITDMGGYWSDFTYDTDIYLASIANERGTWDFSIEPADGNDKAPNLFYSRPGDPMWLNYRITVTNPLEEKEEYYYYSWAGSYTWYVSPKYYIEWENDDRNNLAVETPRTSYFFAATASGTRGEISRILYPDGGHIDYGYDEVTGDRISIIDIHGHMLSFTYNLMGRVTSVTDAKDKTTIITYYANGVDVHEITNGLGTMTLTYDGAHNVISLTDRLGNTTSFTYNDYGQMETQTNTVDSHNIITERHYNSTSHQLENITRGSETLQSFTYDTKGRVETHTDVTGLTLAYEYNDLNNITTVTYPDSRLESYVYSDCCPHLLDSVTDREGRTTYYGHDSLKRLTEITSPGGVIRYEYDANGNLTELIDPNSHATKFQYDVADRPIKMIYADDRYLTATYDGAGLLATQTNARGTAIGYTYDQNHNLLGINYSDDTPDVTYEYDDYNRMTRRTDGIGTCQYTYDASSRLETVDGPWANDTLTYHYDDLGRRNLLEQQGGQTIGYDYDDFNRLTGIHIGTNVYSYGYVDANPLVQAMSRPNGSITTYQYLDPLKRLTKLSNKESDLDIINEYVYGYSSAEQPDLRSSETITNGNPITSFQNDLITYDHNEVNQLLTSIANSEDPLPYDYDEDGNMTQGYTPEGHVFSADYDAENRLKTLTFMDGGVEHKTEYYHSGDGMLAETKKYGGSQPGDSRFVFDGFLPLQIRDEDNDVISEYAWGLNMGGGIGGLLDLKQDSQHYSYLYDGRGNVTALLDSGQAVVAAYGYDAFGNLMSDTPSFSQPFQFSTKPYDAETGLSYFGYRFYSPILGRWMTRDPIGYTDSLNLYDYAGDDPINYFDPLGLVVKGEWDDPANYLDPLGGLAINKTKYFWGRCNEAETAQCKAICASRGKEYESCRWRYAMKDTVRKGETTPAISKLPDGMSCSCKDDEGDSGEFRFPVCIPSPKHHHVPWLPPIPILVPLPI